MRIRANSNLDNYLTCYARQETRASFPNVGSFDHCALLPVYAESFSQIRLQIKSIEHQRTILVIIFNCPSEFEGGNKASIELTRAVYAKTQASFPPIWINEQGVSFHYPDSKDHSSALVVIDRCTTGRELPIKKGVGEARRLAADLLCHLIHKQVINTRWIHSFDADCTLPATYFKISPPKGASAVVFPFQHVGEPNLETLTTLLYELHMRHYVAGLKWAKSPYAFHSIGSCLAFSVDSYAAVRGFPARAAGEDFYLLNKLAKVGDIHTQPLPTMLIQARVSARAPFGTGPSVTKILELDDPIHSFTSYHPQLFVILKEWLNEAEGLWLRQRDTKASAPEDYFSNNTLYFDRELKISILTQLGFFQSFPKLIQQSKTNAQFLKHFHSWFDGFRTLRFLHLVREAGFPDQPLWFNVDAAHLQHDEQKSSPEVVAFHETRHRIITIKTALSYLLSLFICTIVNLL